jgi:hypothetical protein
MIRKGPVLGITDGTCTGKPGYLQFCSGLRGRPHLTFTQFPSSRPQTQHSRIYCVGRNFGDNSITILRGSTWGPGK